MNAKNLKLKCLQLMVGRGVRIFEHVKNGLRTKLEGLKATLQSISQNVCQNTPNFVPKFASSLRSSKVHIEIHKPVCQTKPLIGP